VIGRRLALLVIVSMASKISASTRVLAISAKRRCIDVFQYSAAEGKTTPSETEEEAKWRPESDETGERFAIISLAAE
jgi:hypothetical protein